MLGLPPRRGVHSVALRLAFEPRCRCRCPALGRVHSKGAAARATVSGQTSSHWAALWLVFDYLTCVFGGELGHIQAPAPYVKSLLASVLQHASPQLFQLEQRIARTRAVALIGFGQSGNLSEPSRGLSLYTYKNPKLQRFRWQSSASQSPRRAAVQGGVHGRRVGERRGLREARAHYVPELRPPLEANYLYSRL